MADETHINLFAEFSDRRLERRFLSQQIISGLQQIRYIILLTGLVYLSTIFLDNEASADAFRRNIILATRLMVLLFALVLFLLLTHVRRPSRVLWLVILYEAAVFFHYIGTVYTTRSQNYYNQCMTLIIFFLVLFLLPNRWILRILMAFFSMLLFLLLSVLQIEGLTDEMLRSGAIFLLLTILFSAFSSYQIAYTSRREYLSAKAVRRLSATDPLTGISNRTQFGQDLKAALARGAQGQPFCLVLFDIDNLRRVNDTQGHATGDAVLKDCAKLVLNNSRPYDCFARWDGDEFVLILSGCELQYAKNYARRVSAAIEKQTFANGQKITCGFGVAAYHPQDTSTSITERAAHCLYLAKKPGNACVVCEDEIQSGLARRTLGLVPPPEAKEVEMKTN